MVERDVRLRRLRRVPRARLGNLAGGGMNPTRGVARPAASMIGQGCRDSIAVAVAYVPFGLVVGTSLAATSVPPLVAWSSSPLLFGGAAQLLSVQLLDAGSNAAVVVLGALVEP